MAEASGRRSFIDSDLHLRVSDSEGSRRRRGGGVTYSGTVARLEAHAEQVEDALYVRGQVEGAVILAGGDIFLSKRIDDAFAVVDAGAPRDAV